MRLIDVLTPDLNSFLTKNYKTIGVKVVYDQSDHACEHIRLGRIDTIACEERLTNPRVLESGRDERRKDDHRPC